MSAVRDSETCFFKIYVSFTVYTLCQISTVSWVSSKISHTFSILGPNTFCFRDLKRPVLASTSRSLSLYIPYSLRLNYCFFPPSLPTNQATIGLKSPTNLSRIDPSITQSKYGPKSFPRSQRSSNNIHRRASGEHNGWNRTIWFNSSS